MKLTTDFECGSGELRQVGDAHWRLETVADACGYNKYFCFEIENEKDAPTVALKVDIFPDPRLGEKSHFMGHFPSSIWYSNGDWQRWVPLRNTWEDAVSFHDDHVTLKIPVPPGGKMQIATNVPYRYSALCQWMELLQKSHKASLQIDSIGKSHEGRNIPVLRLGEGTRRFLVVAGQHASEHSGVWASQGIVEYLLSHIAEARRIREEFDIAVVPMLNVDGNVRGRSGSSPQQFQHNNSLDFEGTGRKANPAYIENALLWKWIGESFHPDLLLHFHGYLGRRRIGDEPGDGIYLPARRPDESDDAPRWKLQQAVMDRMMFDTCGNSAHLGIFGETPSKFLDTRLVEAFDTVTVCYECNCGTTGAWSQLRRGTQAFIAMTRAVLLDSI